VSWTLTSPATTDTHPSTKSSLNDRLPHRGRGSGLLESALFRPQTGYYADLIEEAAALWESLSQNQPFPDGNKRTAFAATYTFLAINGAQLTATAQGTQN
jgi:death-on-curing protein